jgi:chromosome segregation ATPase|tara:strand:- start:133 stop:354 length:222 start_codon:yes stop_codon:yes gene_type:complete
MKFLKKKEYKELMDRLDSRKKEIEELTEEKRRLQRVVGLMHQTIVKWKAKKMGNLRAVTEISNWFELRDDGSK